MYETAEDLRALQAILDQSYERAGRHLREVVTVERRVGAVKLAQLLVGVQVLALATVTADGRPLVGAVDGLFYRGSFWFGSAVDSVRLRHIRRRPDVSAVHLRGEELAVTVHGKAYEADLGAVANAGFRRLCLEVYGGDWNEWGAGAAYARIEPVRMFGFAFDAEVPA